MRRLAERPQNLALAYQEFVSTETLKKVGLASAIGIGSLAIFSGATKLLRK